MALTEQHIRNIGIYSIPKFISYGLYFITLPILTRLIHPEDFGVVALALIFPTFATGIITCGLSGAAQRYYFEYRGCKEKLYALFFSSQLFLYGFFFLSSPIVYFFKDTIAWLTIKNNAGMAIFVAFITVYFGQIINFYLSLYQNMERSRAHSVFTILQTVISSGAGLFFVWKIDRSYMGVLYGMMTGAFIVCIAACLHFNRKMIPMFRWTILKENIYYGLQTSTKSLTGFVNRFFDKYMLNNILSLSAVGVYNIGQTMGNALFNMMNSVWSAFQPMCYRDVFDNGLKASFAVGRIFTIFTYLTLFPVLFLILFAEEFVHFLAPPSYYPAIDVIIIIAFGMATQVFGMYISVQYAYSKKAYLIFPMTIISTLINVGANIILIPRFGIIGASVATGITFTAFNGLAVFIGQKLYKIAYSWKILSLLFLILFTATISILFSRSVKMDIFYIYMLKPIFILLFFVIGVRARIITKNSCRRVIGAFRSGRIKVLNNINGNPI